MVQLTVFEIFTVCKTLIQNGSWYVLDKENRGKTHHLNVLNGNCLPKIDWFQLQFLTGYTEPMNFS